MSTELAVWQDDQGRDVELETMTAFREVMGYKDHTDNEIIAFVEFCKAQGLNPYAGDIHFIKIGNFPAYHTIDISVYLRRAERHPQFRGIRSGIIVLSDGQPVRRVGEFRLDDEVLVGAWAEVSRADRDFVFEHSVKFSAVVSRTKDGKPNKQWRENPELMCVKSARKGALKVAFPSVSDDLPEGASVSVVDHEGMVVDGSTGEILSGETVDEAPALPEAQDTVPVDEPLPWANDEPAPVPADTSEAPDDPEPDPAVKDIDRDEVKRKAGYFKANLKATHTEEDYQSMLVALGLDADAVVNDVFEGAGNMPPPRDAIKKVIAWCEWL